MIKAKKKKGQLTSTKPAPLFTAPKQIRRQGENQAIDLLAGKEFELKLEGITPGGEAVATHGGIKFFVDIGCPGQVVLAKVLESGKGTAQATRLKVLQESADQIQPFCSYFGECGGCSWQEIPYEKQLEIKNENLVHTLTKIGGILNPSVQPIVASPSTTHFRTKMEFAFANVKDSSKKTGEATIVGLRKRSSHDVVAIEDCPVASGELVPVLEVIRTWINKSGLTAWAAGGLGGQQIENRILRFVNTRTSNAGHGIAVELVTFPAPNAAKKIRQLADELLNIPSVSLFAHMTREAEDNLAQGERLVFQQGADFLREEVGEFKFDLVPGAFFQTNIGVAKALQKKVLELIELSGLAGMGDDTEAWDLYSGMGTFALALAPIFGRVVGFELAKAAVISARHNALLNGFENCVFEVGDAQKLIRAFSGLPQLIVLDPPRAGLAREIVKTLLIKKVSALIYVSCNPQTLARDIKNLSDKYELISVQGMDMFPHTPHVEAVALLKRYA